ncbi:MAG: hypothetical protein N2444_03830 [Methylocystis sp.]|nr:hypothetical protein [Methylocystis sp.]
MAMSQGGFEPSSRSFALLNVTVQRSSERLSIAAMTRILMEWMPPPDGIAMRHGGDQ